MILCFVLIPSAWAKRIPAPKVKPVIHNGMRYVAPNDNGMRGYIEAWDVNTNKKIWEQTVFENKLGEGVAECLQQVFINYFRAENDNLIITDEIGRKFVLEITTRTVTEKETGY